MCTYYKVIIVQWWQISRKIYNYKRLEITLKGTSELVGAAFTGGFHDVTHEAIQVLKQFKCWQINLFGYVYRDP